MVAWNMPGSCGLLLIVLVANSPQALLSFLFLTYNGLYTCMLMANEWSDYAYERKSLRVSNPVGNQRSTYRLQLPYKYGIPLTVLSGILHWLVSQSLFLARAATFNSDGEENTRKSISTVGYSCIAIITVIILGVIVVALGILNGFRRYRPVMPLVGSCSAAISAACHRPREDIDAATLPVLWGAVSGQEECAVGHCCFTSFEASPPVKGKAYADQHPETRVDEAAPGTGKLCGSMFLNRIFEKHLVETCGSKAGWDTQVKEEAMDRFEAVKKQLSGNASKDFSIPVPGLVDNVQQGVGRGKWNLTGTIRATRREITAVLLVGGFGRSGYLRESLRKELGSNIKVLVPQNGWQAVVRGALMKALAQSIPSSATLKVGSRAARKHYGLESYTHFVDGVHSRSKGEWREFEGEFKTLAMHWFIKKGNRVKEDEPTEFPLYTTRRAKKGRPQDHATVILCCTDPKDKGAPVYRDDGVDYLVRLTANFGSIPESTLDRRMGRDGQEWYFIAYSIRMTTLSASTSYALCSKGKEYGSVTAEYV
ncbi:MAG: hypothetical protein ASARMPRED_003851 [Alectoria sarmentosa]|nr:MAG: hypothetical protein ASARMPRED_003851 [Alectoria sarmentosa]